MKRAARIYWRPISAWLKKETAIRKNLSPGETATRQKCYETRGEALIRQVRARWSEFEKLRAEKEELCHGIEKQKFALQTLAAHERAKLSSHMLTNYCRPETRNGRTHVNWPTYYFLGSVTERVVNYLKFTGERVRPPHPKWKAFKVLDKRLPSLQLPAQVDELVKRAQARLTEDRLLARDARPLMWWLALIGHPSARQLMKFDHVTQVVVKKVKQRITEEKAQTKREATRKRVRQHRALPDSRYIEAR
jgi:hypothetical protein